MKEVFKIKSMADLKGFLEDLAMDSFAFVAGCISMYIALTYF